MHARRKTKDSHQENGGVKFAHKRLRVQTQAHPKEPSLFSPPSATYGSLFYQPSKVEGDITHRIQKVGTCFDDKQVPVDTPPPHDAEFEAALSALPRYTNTDIAASLGITMQVPVEDPQANSNKPAVSYNDEELADFMAGIMPGAVNGGLKEPEEPYPGWEIDQLLSSPVKNLR